MINITLALSNPFSKRDFQSIWTKNFTTPLKNKFIELQVSRDMSIIGASVMLTTRCSHAGLMIEFALLSYCFEFSFYDSRHWDYEQDRFEASELKND